MPDRPDVEVRVEAAAYRGKPVSFRLIGDWTGKEEKPAGAVSPLGAAVWIAILLGGGLLAVRNVRRGRGDRRGAVRLVLFLLGSSLLAWLIGGHHVTEFGGEMGQVQTVVGYAGVFAAAAGVFYLALEPAVRRRWPWRLTAWSRLLAGRFRDPLVGRDLLIGLAAGAGMLLLALVVRLFAAALGAVPSGPVAVAGLDHVPPGTIYSVLVIPAKTVAWSLSAFLLAFLLFLMLRKPWLFWSAYIGLSVVAVGVAAPSPTPLSVALVVVNAAVSLGAMTLVLARFGLLAFTAMRGCVLLLAAVPLTTDFEAWYFWQGAAGAAVVLGLATYGLLTATRGQLLPEGFFADE